MTEALQQQPQLWGVLEAAVRLRGWLMQQQAQQAQQQQQQQQQGDATVLHPSLLAGLLPSTTDQLPTPQLLSMLLSAGKLARWYCTKYLAAVMAFATAVTAGAAASVQCYRRLEAGDGPEGTSNAAASSSSSSSNVLLWLCAATARGLHTLAWALEQEVATAVSSSSSSNDALAVTLQSVSKSEVVYRTSIEMLLCHLGDSAVVGIDSAAYQQLKQVGESLLAAEATHPAMARLIELQASSITGSELQQWAKQLQQFAAAAAAAVPLATACNNPTCSALGGLSETALLKGRRCPRCKAGYCSGACQTAHWKQHKKACKLLAAAGARAWGLPA
jgi:hypothetical protein